MGSIQLFSGAARGRKGQRGVTLAETVIGVAIASTVLVAVASVSVYSGRSLAGMFNYVDLEYKNRAVLDRMTREIRQTTRLTEFTTNRLAFLDFDGQALVYEYLPEQRRLTRVKGGTTETLLNQCDRLQFGAYTAALAPGATDPAANTGVIKKVLSVDWTCSRTLLGAKVHTETVHSAKVIIRKS